MTRIIAVSIVVLALVLLAFQSFGEELVMAQTIPQPTSSPTSRRQPTPEVPSWQRIDAASTDSLYAEWRNTPGNSWPAGTAAELNAFRQHMVALGIPAAADTVWQQGYPVDFSTTSLYMEWRNTPGNSWPAGTAAELNAFSQHMEALGFSAAAVASVRQYRGLVENGARAEQTAIPRAVQTAIPRAVQTAIPRAVQTAISLYVEWRNTPGNSWPVGTETELNAFIRHMAALGIPATADSARQHGYP